MGFIVFIVYCIKILGLAEIENKLCFMTWLPALLPYCTYIQLFLPKSIKYSWYYCPNYLVICRYFFRTPIVRMISYFSKIKSSKNKSLSSLSFKISLVFWAKSVKHLKVFDWKQHKHQQVCHKRARILNFLSVSISFKAHLSTVNFSFLQQAVKYVFWWRKYWIAESSFWLWGNWKNLWKKTIVSWDLWDWLEVQMNNPPIYYQFPKKKLGSKQISWYSQNLPSIILSVAN